MNQKAEHKVLKIYNILSYVSHPIWIHLWAVYTIIHKFSVHFDKFSPTKIAFTILTNNLFYPLAIVVLGKMLGFLDSIKLENKKDRIIPLIVIMIFYYWSFNVSRNAPFPMPFTQYLLGCYISLIVLVLVGMFVKPSLHVAGWMGFTTYLCIAFFKTNILQNVEWIVLSAIVTVLVMFLRLKVRAHTKVEVIGGALVGIISFILASFWF